MDCRDGEEAEVAADVVGSGVATEAWDAAICDAPVALVVLPVDVDEGEQQDNVQGAVEALAVGVEAVAVA